MERERPSDGDKGRNARARGSALLQMPHNRDERAGFERNLLVKSISLRRAANPLGSSLRALSLHVPVGRIDRTSVQRFIDNRIINVHVTEGFRART